MHGEEIRKQGPVERVHCEDARADVGLTHARVGVETGLSARIEARPQRIGNTVGKGGGIA